MVSRATRGADLCRDFDKHVSNSSVQNHRRPRARRAQEKNLEKGMCKKILSHLKEDRTTFCRADSEQPVVPIFRKIQGGIKL